jgi:hypothetical protein
MLTASPTIRRVLVLVALVGAIIVGTGVAAQASFRDSAAVSTTVTTVTVAAPAQISTQNSWCNNGVLNADVTWSSSSTARVSGYTVTAYYQGGEVRVLTTTSSAGTSYASIVPNQGSSRPASISVTTRTTYGWSTESARVAVPSC